MPYEKGGRADKKGNKYEINCIVYELLKVLDGSNYSVVIEALGEDEKGTDILVTNHEGKKEHQQCKARNGSSDNWTISDLKARKIFNAWKIQLDRECDRKVALVSPMTCSFLVDLNDRANNTSGKADEFYDFQIMNSSKEFQSFYENFCKEMNIEIGRESGILKSIDYLKRIYYKQISEYEIQELITQNIQYQFSSPKDMVYDAFVSMIVSKDILGRELTQIALIDYIEKKNIKFQLREDDGRIGFRIKELNQEYRESFRTLQEGLIHRKEFDNCIKYPEYAANDYVDVKTMMLKFEERTLRLLSFWIDKKIDSKGKNVYRYEEELVDGKNDFMVKNETMILDRLLKYVPKETGTGVIYSEWSNKYLHKRGIERACVELIKKANIVLCSKRPEEFWEYYNPYMGKGYTVFNESRSVEKRLNLKD